MYAAFFYLITFIGSLFLWREKKEEKDNYAETVEIINKSNNSSLPWESSGDNGMILLYKYLL